MKSGAAEVAAGVRIGEDKNRLRVIRRQEILQPGFRVEGGSRVGLFVLRGDGGEEHLEVGGSLCGQGGIAWLIGEAESRAHVYAEALKLEDERIEGGIKEAGLHQVGEALVAHADFLGKRFGVFQFGQRGGFVGVGAVKLEPLGCVRRGEHGVFGGGEAERFGEDVGEIVGRGWHAGKQLERVGGAQHVEHLREQLLEVAEEAAHRINPQIKRQIERIERLAQRRGINLCEDVLRLGSQVGGRSATGVVGEARIERVVRNEVFQDFIHQIDVRHGRVGVHAG